jgi:hypothetical protein
VEGTVVVILTSIAFLDLFFFFGNQIDYLLFKNHQFKQKKIHSSKGGTTASVNDHKKTVGSRKNSGLKEHLNSNKTSKNDKILRRVC